MNEFTDLQNKNSTIGSYLKHLREEKDIALKVISRRTKISITMLEFLENDSLDKMPNRAYVRGYVKSYSKELGIDPREALKYLDMTYQSLSDTPAEKNTQPVDSKSSASSSLQLPPLSILSVAGAVFLIIALVVVIKSNKEKDLEVTDSPPISQQVLSDKTPLKLEKAVEVETEEQKALEPQAQQQDEDKKTDITFYNTINPLYSIAENIDESTQKLLPPYISKQMIKGKQNLYISAHAGATWLTYKRDDEIIRKVLLEKGQTLFITGDELRLFFGNIKAATLFLNNQLMLTPSRTGVKSLIIPIEMQSKYKLPLFVFDKNGTVSTSDEYLKNKTN